MRKILFTTVAVAAFSCAGIAVQAQEHQGGVGGAGGQMGAPSQHGGPSGAQGTMGGPEHGPGGAGGAGAMRHAQGAEQGGPGSETMRRSAGQQPGATEGTRSMGREGARSTEGMEHHGQEFGNKSAEQRRGGEDQNRSAEEQRGNERNNRSMSEERGSERTDRSVNEQRGGELRTGRAVEEGEGGRGHVQINAGQRSRIVDRIRSSRVESISHVDFAVNVGTVVPTHYHFYPLPAEIVDIVPEYRGYNYIVVGDQILIIDPFTHRIVDVIDEAG